MKTTLRVRLLAGVLATMTVLGVGVSSARAHDPSGGGRHHRGRGDFGGYDHGYRYYGNGGHDSRPHWHTTQTPYGSFVWYGIGAHDFRPHEHVYSPYGGYRGYSPNRFGGVTTSYYPSTPYTYMPW
jgi:hypothetical protein